MCHHAKPRYPIMLKSWQPYHGAWWFGAFQPLRVRSLRATGGRLLAVISAVAWASRSYLYSFWWSLVVSTKSTYYPTSYLLQL